LVKALTESLKSEQDESKTFGILVKIVELLRSPELNKSSKLIDLNKRYEKLKKRLKYMIGFETVPSSP
jgi:hypothetical protein